jgi:hypothetical protein
MSLMPLTYGETLRLLHAGTPTLDEYGNDVPGAVTAQIVPGCTVWPATATTGTETVGELNSVIVGLVAFLPPGVMLTPADQIVVRGALYEVDGEPGWWRSYLTGTQAGTQVTLRRVEG